MLPDGPRRDDRGVQQPGRPRQFRGEQFRLPSVLEAGDPRDPGHLHGARGDVESPRRLLQPPGVRLRGRSRRRRRGDQGLDGAHRAGAPPGERRDRPPRGPQGDRLRREPEGVALPLPARPHPGGRGGGGAVAAVRSGPLGVERPFDPRGREGKGQERHGVPVLPAGRLGVPRLERGLPRRPALRIPEDLRPAVPGHGPDHPAPLPPDRALRPVPLPEGERRHRAEEGGRGSAPGGPEAAHATLRRARAPGEGADPAVHEHPPVHPGGRLRQGPGRPLRLRQSPVHRVVRSPERPGPREDRLRRIPLRVRPRVPRKRPEGPRRARPPPRRRRRSRRATIRTSTSPPGSRSTTRRGRRRPSAGSRSTSRGSRRRKTSFGASPTASSRGRKRSAPPWRGSSTTSSARC